MRTGWKTFRFDEFLRPDVRPYLLGSAEDANLVGVRWYGEGPFHRELKSATKIAKKAHFQIRAGDVIYNKLFAWKGTFGIVPPALEGMFVSDKFPTYELNRARVSDRFLGWYFKYAPLWEQAREKSTGSAAISKLTLNPPRLLELTLSAPSDVKEQEAIADRLDAHAAKVNEIRSLKIMAEPEIKALSQAIISHVLSHIPSDGRLGAVFTQKPRNGWSPKCDNSEDGVAVLGLGAITGFHYKPMGVKKTSIPTDPDADYWLQPNDLLISRSNTPELVGHAAIYSGEPTPCIYPDLMMRLTVDESQTHKKFVWYWLQTKQSRKFIESKAKGTSPTMKKISQEVVAAIPFPASVSLDLQVQKVSQLDHLLTAVFAMASISGTWQTEVNALIPAMLKREFGWPTGTLKAETTDAR